MRTFYLFSRWLGAIALCLGALGLSATPAFAASYSDMVASQLKMSHVFVDSKAVPLLTGDDARQLDRQIVTSGKPIYIAFLDDTRLGGADPRSLPSTLFGALQRAGITSAVVGVSDKGNFSAQGFNVPASIAQQAGPLATQTMADKTKSPFQRVTAYVTSLTNIPVPPSTRTITTTARSSGASGWLILLYVVLGLTVVGLIAFVVVKLVRRSQRRKRLKVLLDTLGSNIYDMLALDLRGPARESIDAANRSYLAAKSSLESGDLVAATGYLKEAQRFYDRAVSPSTSATDEPAFTPPRGPKRVVNEDELKGKSVGDIRVQRPDGGTVVINNYTRQPIAQPGYGHYFIGGYYGGIYFDEGFYAFPFWTCPIVERRYDYGGDNGYPGGGSWDGGDDVVTTTTTTDMVASEPLTTGDVGGGSWGSSSDSSPDTGYSGSDSYNSGSSGGDWGFGGDGGFSGGDSGGSW